MSFLYLVSDNHVIMSFIAFSLSKQFVSSNYWAASIKYTRNAIPLTRCYCVDKKSGDKVTDSDSKLTEKSENPENNVSDWIKQIHATDKYRPPIVAKYRRQNYDSPIDRTIGILKDDVNLYFKSKIHFFKQLYQILFVQSKESDISNKFKSEDETSNLDIKITEEDEVGTVSGNQKIQALDIILEQKKMQEKSTTRSYFGKVFTLPKKKDIFPQYCDVLIIGGGAVGSSIAYHLKEAAGPGLDIVMLEKDSTYKNASTVLSVGGIRHQFSLPENILLSKYGMQFMQELPRLLEVDGLPPPDINFQPHGYLTLASEKGLKQLQENYYVQNYFDAKVQYLEPSQIKRQFPYMNMDGIAGGILGVESEGWFDPWSLLIGLRRKAVNLGVQCVEGELVGCDLGGPEMNKYTDGHPSNSERRIRECNVSNN